MSKKGGNKGEEKKGGFKFVWVMQSSVVDVSGNSSSSSWVPGFLAFVVVDFGRHSFDPLSVLLIISLGSSCCWQ